MLASVQVRAVESVAAPEQAFGCLRDLGAGGEQADAKALQIHWRKVARGGRVGVQPVLLLSFGWATR